MADVHTLLQAFPADSEEAQTIRTLIGYRADYVALEAALATPPAGWFTFGHHAGDPAAPQLEFWGEHAGLPLWERPAEPAPEVFPWHGARPGEEWDVQYVTGLQESTGWLNKDGVHTVYEANRGRFYFLGDESDKTRHEVTSSVIRNARRIR